MFYPKFPKFLCTMVSAFLLSLSNPLAAAPPSPAQLDEFMRASRMQEMLSPAMVAMEKEVRQTMDRLAQQLNMEEGRKQRFDQAVVQRLMPQIRNEMSWQTLSPLLQEAFMQALSAQDIEVVLAFHRSPAGRAYHAVVMELLKDPSFIHAINSGNKAQLELMLRPKLSASDFQALQEFNNAPAVQQVQNKAKQVLPEIMQRSLAPRIETVVQHFLEQELADL